MVLPRPVELAAVIGKVGPGTDGFRPRDQTRIKTPGLVR